MNTQTHVLLALAVLGRVSANRNRQSIAASPGSSRTVSTSSLPLLSAIIAGALVPDAGLFLMWGQAKLRGIPESRIWSELYYSEFWQDVGAWSNSIPVFVVLLVLACLAGARLHEPSHGRPDWATPLLVFALAALLHVLTDLPLHHDDGHPHFWPFSDWIFSSPISYWDPRHYGRWWSIVEILLAIVLIVLLWRRFSGVRFRSLLVLAALSYGIVAAYWLSAFS